MVDLMFNADRWRDLCDRLDVPAAHGARGRFPELALAYAEPQRHYHTAQHIGECLAWLDRVGDGAGDAPLIELALWLHDAVYQPRAADNEAQSAALARHWFDGALTADRLDRLARWIEATRTHTAAPDEPDRQLLLDIDLSILAAPDERFAEYEAQVRREYAFVPGLVFQLKRRQFLRQLGARPQLFGHPAMQHLEPVARHRLPGG